MRKRIIELFPEHNCYVEVFGGAAWVLFGKPSSKVEVYNDFDGELVNFFRVLKYHLPEFERIFRDLHASRELFVRYKEGGIEYLTEIERAVRFYYLNKLSFAGKMESFGSYYKNTPIGFNENASKVLELAKARFRNVWIEKLSFEKVIEKFDTPSTLFYCDPPYYGSNQYKSPFDEKEHRALWEVLQRIDGKFVLSYNDCEFIRDLYNGNNIIEITTQYSVSKDTKGRGKYDELIIYNFENQKHNCGFQFSREGGVD